MVGWIDNAPAVAKLDVQVPARFPFPDALTYLDTCALSHLDILQESHNKGPLFAAIDLHVDAIGWRLSVLHHYAVADGEHRGDVQADQREVRAAMYLPVEPRRPEVVLDASMRPQWQREATFRRACDNISRLPGPLEQSARPAGDIGSTGLRRCRRKKCVRASGGSLIRDRTATVPCGDEHEDRDNKATSRQDTGARESAPERRWLSPPRPPGDDPVHPDPGHSHECPPMAAFPLHRFSTQASPTPAMIQTQITPKRYALPSSLPLGSQRRVRNDQFVAGCSLQVGDDAGPPFAGVCVTRADSVAEVAVALEQALAYGVEVRRHRLYAQEMVEPIPLARVVIFDRGDLAPDHFHNIHGDPAVELCSPGGVRHHVVAEVSGDCFEQLIEGWTILHQLASVSSRRRSSHSVSAVRRPMAAISTDLFRPVR